MSRGVGLTTMSPFLYSSTRWPGRAYRNQNLAILGTGSCTQHPAFATCWSPYRSDSADYSQLSGGTQIVHMACLPANKIEQTCNSEIVEHCSRTATCRWSWCDVHSPGSHASTVHRGGVMPREQALQAANPICKVHAGAQVGSSRLNVVGITL